MPNDLRPVRARIVRCAATALLLSAMAGAGRAADLGEGFDQPYGSPAGSAGGGVWAPLVPVRPPSVRYDVYGYPILGPGLVGRPAPHVIGAGCPLALQPAYDPDGNLAGYAPLQFCR